MYALGPLADLIDRDDPNPVRTARKLVANPAAAGELSEQDLALIANGRIPETTQVALLLGVWEVTRHLGATKMTTAIKAVRNHSNQHLGDLQLWDWLDHSIVRRAALAGRKQLQAALAPPAPQPRPEMKTPNPRPLPRWMTEEADV